MDAQRYDSYKQTKNIVDSMGAAMLGADEQARIVDCAEGLLLSADDDTAAGELRDATFELIDSLLANRPSWSESQETAERLRDALRGCHPALDLVAA